MNINENILDYLVDSKENKQKINILNLNSLCINKINLNNSRFEFIEFLSLKNNQLRDIGFIISFPFLWYLDIRDNIVKYFFSENF